jgi:hypothetical protein
MFHVNQFPSSCVLFFSRLEVSHSDFLYKSYRVYISYDN